MPLDDTLMAFYRDLCNAPADRQQAVMATLLPTEADLRDLFPDHHDDVWDLVERSNREILASTPDWVKGAKEAGPVLGVNRSKHAWGGVTRSGPTTVAVHP